MIEIEMKFKIDHSKIIPILINLGARNINTEFNHDIYYNHPHKNYKITDESFRVRQTDNDIYITYKGPKLNNESKSRKEINVTVNSDIIHEMLGYLEFQKEAEVKKTRSIWKLGKYTICLDLVDNLGEYIEIEYILPQNHNFEKELNQMKSFITRLKIDVDDQILEGYLDLLSK